MVCIDDEQDFDFSLYGQDDNTATGRITVNLFSCRPGIDEGCTNSDLNALLDYLQPIQLFVLYNRHRFNSQEFLGKALIQESNLYNQQVNFKLPNFIDSHL